MVDENRRPGCLRYQLTSEGLITKGPTRLGTPGIKKKQLAPR